MWKGKRVPLYRTASRKAGVVDNQLRLDRTVELREACLLRHIVKAASILVQ